MSLRFAGKHCAVVGATGIIGSQIARAFAANGAVVSLLGRSVLDRRSKLENQLPVYSQQLDAVTKEQIPSSHQFIRLDLADAAMVKSVFSSRSSAVRQPHFQR